MNNATTIEIPPGDPSNDMRPEKPRSCVGCRGYHGSIGAGFNCMEAMVVHYRGLAEELLKENKVLRRIATMTPEQFAANQRQSEYFDRTRGKLKPSL